MTLDHTTIPDNNDSLQPKDESTTTEENGAIHYKNIYPVIVFPDTGAAYFVWEPHTFYWSRILYIGATYMLFETRLYTTITDLLPQQMKMGKIIDVTMYM